jgi:hypothetical protein
MDGKSKRLKELKNKINDEAYLQLAIQGIAQRLTEELIELEQSRKEAQPSSTASTNRPAIWRVSLE